MILLKRQLCPRFRAEVTASTSIDLRQAISITLCLHVSATILVEQLILMIILWKTWIEHA